MRKCKCGKTIEGNYDSGYICEDCYADAQPFGPSMAELRTGPSVGFRERSGVTEEPELVEMVLT